MFSLFKKRVPAIKVDDIIWMNEERKLEALAKISIKTPDTIFIAWFEETYEKLALCFTQHGFDTDKIHVAQKVFQHQVQNVPVVFVEHFPLRDKEEEVYQSLGLQKAVVHSALDEPFLKTFGSNKIIELMNKLGAKEDEPIQHAMISSSIKNAQEKLKQKISFGNSARSQTDWIRQNLPH